MQVASIVFLLYINGL